MADRSFAPNPDAAAEWLTTLQKEGPKSRAHQLYQSLKTLNTLQLESSLRLAILEVLRQSIFATSDVLAAEFTVLTPPLTESARSTAKLSAFLHHELALGYEQLPNHHSPLSKQRALASLGQMMLRIIQLGEPIANSTWRRLFNHYRQGEEEGWLHFSVTEPLSQLGSFSPLEQIKCILAFMALNPMQHDPSCLPQGWLFLEKHKDKLTIADNPSTNCWYFDPDQAQPPCRYNHFPNSNERTRYLNIETRVTNELPRSMRTRWQHHLVQLSDLAYQKEKRVDELWCGWECTLSELKRWQRTPLQNTQWLSVPDFEVILPDTPCNSTKHGDNSDWHRPHRHVNALLKQYPNDSMAMIETNVCLCPGELLGLKFLDETIQLAVIRWIQPGMFGNQGRFGLDLLDGRFLPTTAIIPGLGPEPAIHFISSHQEDLLLLPQSRLKPGISILVEDREYRIARLREWGNDFCAYLLAP